MTNQKNLSVALNLILNISRKYSECRLHTPGSCTLESKRTRILEPCRRTCGERSKDVSITSQRRAESVYKTQISRNLLCHEPLLYYLLAIYLLPHRDFTTSITGHRTTTLFL